MYSRLQVLRKLKELTCYTDMEINRYKWIDRGFNYILSCTLTHWGRVTHICVGKLTIIASDNGLSPGRRQAIIWTNAGILLIGPLGTKFNEILIEIHTFSFTKMHLKMSSAKWRLFCLGPNVLTLWGLVTRGCEFGLRDRLLGWETVQELSYQWNFGCMYW